MYEVLKCLVTSIAPVLVFTAEEIWQNMPKTKDAPESIHLNLWPDTENLKVDKPLETKWQKLMNLREVVLKMLEEKRSSGIIGSSLEAKILIYVESDEFYSSLEQYNEVLPSLFIVSQVSLKKGKPSSGAAMDEKMPGVSVIVEKADGKKCSRCWNFSITVGENKNYPDACQRCQEILKPVKGEV